MTATTFIPTDAAMTPEALDYATPAPPRPWSGSKRELCLGIAAGVLISAGLGSLLFGALMALGVRDEQAGLMAFGTSCITLGGTFIALIVWFRRNSR